MTPCFECGAPAEHDHHVIPRSLGGTKTIPLCEKCHAKVHDRECVTIRALIQHAIDQKKARNERIGHVTYGYRLANDGKTLEPEPSEQAVIEEARRLRAEGLTLRAVAAELAASGLTSRNGKVFHPKQVDRMLETKPPPKPPPISTPTADPLDFYLP